MTENRAAINIRKIESGLLTAGDSMDEDLISAIEERLDEAKAARAAGDDQEAIAITNKILERMEKTETSA
ncbi:hypothetical protein [Streptomyces sp. LUP30]|uniref:hypothetical protein n=1 Tax=Streptomyces sp. LUP30 TaxID=1890285 RepID=UPI000851979C|nr:hypothetical protein [Streptomyces sp. LUP30]